MDFKKIYFDLWATAWEFHKKYFDENRDCECWGHIVDERNEILKQYEGKEGHGLLKALIFAVVDELERMDEKVEQDGKL